MAVRPAVAAAEVDSALNDVELRGGRPIGHVPPRHIAGLAATHATRLTIVSGSFTGPPEGRVVTGYCMVRRHDARVLWLTCHPGTYVADARDMLSFAQAELGMAPWGVVVYPAVRELLAAAGVSQWPGMDQYPPGSVVRYVGS